MSFLRALLLAIVVAAAITATAIVGLNVPTHWAILIGLPFGAITFAGALLGGTYDAEWTAPPELPSASVTLHATYLTERLEYAETDQYRFTSRVQPRLRRIAAAALREDLDSPRAKERLGADLHRLVTDPHAELPPPTTFAAMMRRLEELC